MSIIPWQAGDARSEGLTLHPSGSMGTAGEGSAERKSLWQVAALQGEEQGFAQRDEAVAQDGAAVFCPAAAHRTIGIL